MDIKRLILLPEGNQPTAGEAVTAKLQAEASCLLVTIEMGQEKADVFLWRDEGGQVWGRITNADQGRKGEYGQEVNLFPTAATEPVVETTTSPDAAPPAEEDSKPEMKQGMERTPAAPVPASMPEAEEIPF